MTDNIICGDSGSTNLGSEHCTPCTGNANVVEAADIDHYLSQIHDDWVLDQTGTAITRNFKVKGFAKAVYLSNLCVWLADSQGHHPDVSFGWGYCSVTMTTHELNGLSRNDFVWAAKLDQLVDNVP